MHVLSENQETLLKNERHSLNELRVALAQIGTEPGDQQTLSESIELLEEIFLLVVVGEFNSGKSSFINALLGQKLLKEGVTPTTTQINVLRYGENQQISSLDNNQLILSLPAPLLEEISIVDTPGTNAIIREHEQITSQFIPKSDLVLFITSADRPFTESENAFLHSIKDWGKKVVIIINKIDILQSEEDLQQVIQFVDDHARTLFGSSPDIFPISARLGLAAKQGKPEQWKVSRLEPLEQYIQEKLDEKSRVQLKFLNPLGVSQNILSRYLNLTIGRLDLLKEDTSMLEDVDSQLSMYQKDMMRDFNFRMADIENILFDMEKRGDTYFDSTFRLARVVDLIGRSRIQQEFEHTVVADVPQQVERKVNEMIDWFVEANLHQWQAVTDHLAERRRQHQTRIVGDTSVGTFHYDREHLIDAVGQKARHVIETYDRDAESRLIADGAQEAVATSAALGIGAIGLGAVVAALATTVAADVTGLLLASLIAALGLFVIPAKRRQAKSQMNKKIAILREKLTGSLREQFQHEVERSARDIHEAIAPYTRFVRSERQKLIDAQEKLSAIQNDLNQIKNQIIDL